MLMDQNSKKCLDPYDQERGGGGDSHRNAIRACAAQMGRFLTKNP